MSRSTISITPPSKVRLHPPCPAIISAFHVITIQLASATNYPRKLPLWKFRKTTLTRYNVRAMKAAPWRNYGPITLSSRGLTSSSAVRSELTDLLPRSSIGERPKGKSRPSWGATMTPSVPLGSGLAHRWKAIGGESMAAWKSGERRGPRLSSTTAALWSVTSFMVTLDTECRKHR